MKVLYKYLIREMFLPFLLSLLMITFILFINFLIRAIDRFLGKGIDALVILEYLFLNLAWIIALSVPMAILLTTLMTFGRMSEENEINAMKASGISFSSIIKPPLIFGTLVTLFLIFFNNYILPDMNFHARLLSGDIYRKRPSMNIEPGIFLNNLPGYNMIIGDKSGEIMSDVRIFSKDQKKSQTSIYAKSGVLTTLYNTILLTLHDGEIHELENKKFNNYRRIIFSKHNIKIKADDIILNRRDSSSRTDREMTIPMIKSKVLNYEKRIEVVKSRIMGSFFRVIGDSISPHSIKNAMETIKVHKEMITKNKNLTKNQIHKKERQIRNLERQIKNEFGLIKSYQKGRNKYQVEIHKKFSIPFACIIFVLIGGPIGVMAKKGGFSNSIILSFGFFLIYYLMLIGGEELADRNKLPAMICMWSPNLIFLIFALYLNFITIHELSSKSLMFFKKAH